jgi:uncharacterized protein YggU (UPF0235/DUF167 family)
MVDHRLRSVVADGIMIAIRVTPKSGHDAIGRIDRLAAGRAVVKARVRAAPRDGAATRVRRLGLPP